MAKKPISPASQFGALLKKMRVAAGLKQADLAEAAELTQGTVSQLESGASNPTLETIVKLAEALGCQPRDLIPLVDTRPPLDGQSPD